MPVISAIGDEVRQHDDLRQRDGANDGGRLGGGDRGSSIASAMRSITAGLAVGFMAGQADAFAGLDQQFGQREGDDQAAVQLALVGIACEAKSIEGERSGHIHTVGRPPIPARGHRDDRRAPSAASRLRPRLAGDERRNCQKFSPGPARGGRAGRG